MEALARPSTRSTLSESSPFKFPIALGLRMLQSRGDPKIGATMAMTLLSVIPLLVVFYTAQRYFIQGIVTTGVKG